MVRAAGGFTQFNLVECNNDSFNLTLNALTLVVWDMTAALTALADPKDIFDAVDPVMANVEEIQTLRSTTPWMHSYPS